MCYYAVSCIAFFKEINTFIKWGCKIDSKDTYNVTKDFYSNRCCLLNLSENKKNVLYGFHKNMNQSKCFEHFSTASLVGKFKKESRCQLQVVYSTVWGSCWKTRCSRWFILKGKSTIIPCVGDENLRYKVLLAWTIHIIILYGCWQP